MSEKESFHFHFVNHTTPWLGLIYDYESGTRIEVNREKENIEEALFRTQGELIASYRVERIRNHFSSSTSLPPMSIYSSLQRKSKKFIH